jgi:hypothetical protein
VRLIVEICLHPPSQDDLLDLYLYYCVIGMRDTSPALRAACVAMLSVIAVQNADIVVGIVGAHAVGCACILPVTLDRLCGGGGHR